MILKHWSFRMIYILDKEDITKRVRGTFTGNQHLFLFNNTVLFKS